MRRKGFPSSEYELIYKIQSILGKEFLDYYPQSIGDDAALRCDKQGNRIILTSDISVENVHFSLAYMSMSEIGYRAMVSNLSDCAAMGALPDAALIQLVIPENTIGCEKSIEELYHGFREACIRWRFPIVGGDLSIGKQWVIAITLLGRVARGKRVLLRKGMKPGDRLWVSGIPGLSAAGLCVLRKWGRKAIPEKYLMLANAHIRPHPRIETGISIAGKKKVHAVMDLSDGLSKDCRTLAYENNCGIIIRPIPSQIPQSMLELSQELDMPWEQWFLHGGEDYELLFSAEEDFNPAELNLPPGERAPICIGECTDKIDMIAIEQNGKIAALPTKAFDHLKTLLR